MKSIYEVFLPCISFPNVFLDKASSRHQSSSHLGLDYLLCHKDSSLDHKILYLDGDNHLLGIKGLTAREIRVLVF